MRFTLLVSAFLLSSLTLAPVGTARAQIRDDDTDRVPGIELPDVQEANGYTIRVVRLERGSYGYQIRRGSQVLVHQRRNPYTGSTRGLQSREDARKTAGWVLQNVVLTDRMRPYSLRLPQTGSLGRYIPTTVAASLGVTLENR
jgi:hypothetical protein